MNCAKFMALTEWEKANYMASLIHVCQSDNNLFKSGKHLIELGQKRGLFEGVKLFPEHLITEENERNTEFTKS